LKSTSDLTVKVKGQSIYVHKAILKIRSLYFRRMFQGDWIENNQWYVFTKKRAYIFKHFLYLIRLYLNIFFYSIMICHHYSYVVYVTFLRYLYTGMINKSAMSSMKNLLGESNNELNAVYITSANYLFVADLLKLANAYCEENLESDCIWMIKKRLTVSNFFPIIDVAVKCDIKVTESIAFFLFYI